MKKQERIKLLYEIRNSCFDDDGEELFSSLINEVDDILDEMGER